MTGNSVIDLMSAVCSVNLSFFTALANVLQDYIPGITSLQLMALNELCPDLFDDLKKDIGFDAKMEAAAQYVIDRCSSPLPNASFPSQHRDRDRRLDRFIM